jgi:hypothetical protein
MPRNHPKDDIACDHRGNCLCRALLQAKRSGRHREIGILVAAAFLSLSAIAAPCTPPQVVNIQLECTKVNDSCRAEEPVTLRAMPGPDYRYDAACDTFVWTKHRNNAELRQEFSSGSNPTFTFSPAAVYHTTTSAPWDVQVVNAAGVSPIVQRVVSIAPRDCGPASGAPERIVARFSGRRSGCATGNGKACYRDEVIDFEVDLVGQYVASPCDLVRFRWLTGSLVPDYSASGRLSRTFTKDGRFEALVEFMPRGFSSGVSIASTASATVVLDVAGEAPVAKKRRSARN